MESTNAINWETLSPAEKKRQLYLKQKDTLDMLLTHRAITQAQYDKSLGDLTVKMGFSEEN